MLQSVTEFFEAFGAWGLMLHAFADAIVFPVPAFFLQVSLSLLDPANALWLATAGFVGCLLGTPIGYGIGRLLGQSVLEKLLRPSWVDAARRLFDKNGEAAILIGSFTPIPFKVFTILSGCLNYPLWKLMAYAAIGRAAKFYVVGVLFYWFGRTAEGMVKEATLCLLAVASVLLLALLVRRRFKRKSGIMEEKASGASGVGEEENR